MATTAKHKKLPDADPLRRPFSARILRKATAVADRYQLVFWREDGQWFGRGLEMPFCMGDGKTLAACERVTRRSIVLGVAALMEEGQSVPNPLLDQERPRRRRAR